MPEAALREGDVVQGFRVHRVTGLPHMGSIAYELEHPASGARILHISNDDSENLFSIALRTPPDDDTGTPHILEHSVLSGSRKFPVKDPFVAMTRMSMATFINAMTGIDYTVYPVASNVRQDLFNLADVYWDAVFHPFLSEETFKQEGHHLDFADRSDLTSPLVVSGVVFNEMKGAYSVPERWISQALFSTLFGDTPYGLSSGGDPVAIPDLSYEQFVAYYQRLYRPENAFVFLYGDVPTVEYLEFLAPRLEGYERDGMSISPMSQPRWSAPRRTECEYPVGSEDAVEARTFHQMAWLCGDSRDTSDVLRFGVLSELLLGTFAAPLHRALIDSKLGENLTASSSFTHGIDSGFLVGIKGSEPDRREAFEKLVLETLERCATEGFAADRIDAAFHQYAYVTLEITQRYPLVTAMNAYSLWLHGSDPLAYLRAQETLDALHDEVRGNEHAFSAMIRERLLDNPHRLTQTSRPVPGLAQVRDAEAASKLAAHKQSMSPEDLERIAREAEDLERTQGLPNSAEALATLPQLRVADLPRKPREIPTEVETLDGGITAIRNDVFANGVNYMKLSFDLSELPVELWNYVALFGRCISKMGAGGHDYAAMTERVAATTGGISFSPAATGHAIDPDGTVLAGTYMMKTLDGRIDDALAVLRDVIFDLDLGDIDRLRDVIVQEKATYRTQAPASGNVYATRHAVRGLGPLGGITERMYGVPQPRLMLRLADGFDAECDQLVANLEAIRRHLLDGRRLTLSFTGAAAAYDRVRQTVGSWAADLGLAGRAADGRPTSGQASAAVPAAAYELPSVSRQGFAAPVDVAFCAAAFPAPHDSDERGAALQVAGLVLSRGHLWDEIRAKGGAYGVRCTWNGIGKWWVLSSYRDPHIDETLETFRGVTDHVRAADWSQDEIDRTVIAAAKDAERPIRPDSATALSMWRHLQGESAEVRERNHMALLDLRASDVKRAVLEVFEAGLPQRCEAVVASRERLERTDFPIEDLM